MYVFGASDEFRIFVGGRLAPLVCACASCTACSGFFGLPSMCGVRALSCDFYIGIAIAIRSITIVSAIGVFCRFLWRLDMCVYILIRSCLHVNLQTIRYPKWISPLLKCTTKAQFVIKYVQTYVPMKIYTYSFI